MSLNHLVNVLARRRAGALVLGGIAAVLDGVERLMSAQIMSAQKQAAAPVQAAAARASVRKDFFTIKRTQSDLGFTFWVLQGHGVFASFELFDTWVEALAAAEARLAVSQPEPLSAAV